MNNAHSFFSALSDITDRLFKRQQISEQEHEPEPKPYIQNPILLFHRDMQSYTARLRSSIATAIAEQCEADAIDDDAQESLYKSMEHHSFMQPTDGGGIRVDPRVSDYDAHLYALLFVANLSSLYALIPETELRNKLTEECIREANHCDIFDSHMRTATRCVPMPQHQVRFIRTYLDHMNELSEATGHNNHTPALVEFFLNLVLQPHLAELSAINLKMLGHSLCALVSHYTYWWYGHRDYLKLHKEQAFQTESAKKNEFLLQH